MGIQQIVKGKNWFKFNSNEVIFLYYHFRKKEVMFIVMSPKLKAFNFFNVVQECIIKIKFCIFHTLKETISAKLMDLDPNKIIQNNIQSER